MRLLIFRNGWGYALANAVFQGGMGFYGHGVTGQMGHLILKDDLKVFQPGGISQTGETVDKIDGIPLETSPNATA